MVRVCVISDTHNFHIDLPKLPDADILIHAGDATIRSSLMEIKNFAEWFEDQPHKHKVFVPGNHDWMLTRKEANGIIPSLFKKTKLLVSNSITIEGLKIFGVAIDYDLRFIPENLDILITHYPPNGILDEIPPHSKFNETPHSEYIGSNIVLQHVLKSKPRYHFFGHVHEQGGCSKVFGSTTFYNCAQMDERYNLRYRPIVLDIEPESR